MTANLITDGKILLVSGKVAIHDDCCCWEGGTCCGDGESCDRQPEFISVTFSGIQNCGADPCLADCVSQNGTLLLPSRRGCQWHNVINPGDVPRAFVIFAGQEDCDDGKVTVKIRARTVAVGLAKQCFFADVCLSEDDCDRCDDLTVSPISNQLACDGSTLECRGHNGTVTISFV